jgi:ribosomal protein S18
MAASIRILLGSCTRRSRSFSVLSSSLSQPLHQNILSSKTQHSDLYCVRFFTDGKNKDDDDPFGVNFQDGTDLGNLGPKSPPRYKRDAVTGKFTGEEEEELTESEKKLLNMDPIQEQDYLLDKVLNGWNIDLSKEDKENDTFPEPVKLSELAKRIRQDNAGMTTLGRSVESQSFRGKLEDGGEDAYLDETGFSKPLSPSEFNIFKKHMKDEYDADIDEDDIPVEPTNDDKYSSHQYGSGSDDDDDDDSLLGGYADTEELNNKWMSSGAMRFMDDTKDDDPFSDLLPSDLSPTLLVNRRKAKAIPRQLLHHNNLALLRRYITPSGQIMNRVQSRLGAKDQRKISKLIKRARHLGLIPMSGQFVVEAHGNIHEKDIHEDKDWEKELHRRGLVVETEKKQQKE